MGTVDSSSPSRFLILGTAGHIDHGKTALIRALTGTDTDRLPEEKRRGMTIELGFAELNLGAVCFGVVDVPGHERFVRTMVSGAAAVDVALLVVAADDSVMPQTVEHVEILSLLNLQAAVVAITKTDVVDAELAELVAEEVRELLAPTPLRDAPIVRVSAVTGAGIDDLRASLLAVVDRVAERRSRPPFRMAIDRVFTVQGRGTVVTGSVLRGAIGVGDGVEVWPGGLSCRVRGLQTHGRSSEHLQFGQRAALNLIGADREAIERGCDIATPGYLRPSRMADARFRCLASCARPIRPFSRVRLCIGTRELLARFAPIDREPVHPGAETYIQLRASTPIIASHGQRFIVRDEVASRTMGGGIILRCQARRWTADRQRERAALEILETGDDTARVSEVLRDSPFESLDALTVCARAGVEVGAVREICASLDQTGRRVALDGSERRYPRSGVEDLLNRAERWLGKFHERNAEQPGCQRDAFLGWLDRKSGKGLGRSLLDRLVKQNRVKMLGPYVCLPAFAPELSAQDERVLAAMLDEFHAAAFQPPRLEALKVAQQSNLRRVQRLAKIAQATRQLVELQNGLYLHPDRERELLDTIRDLTANGEGFTVSQLKERLNSSRKFMVPMVEYLDRVGHTRRQGDLRFVKDP